MASLDHLKSVLHEHEVIQEAWLLRTLVTPSGGAAQERTEIALAFDPPLTPQQGEGPASTATEVVVELTKAAKTAGLDVQGWVLVNDAIRSLTELYGLKIYARAAPPH
jgi:hypothetical protein